MSVLPANIASTTLVALLSLLQMSGCFFRNDIDPPFSGNIPARPKNALTGTAFIQKTKNLSIEEREQMILQEILSGNVPNFLRKLKAVHFQAVVTGKKKIKGIVWVMPDYLAIGSDRDFVRIPMSPISAQRIADAWGFVLPTTKIVNQIYREAKHKLAPQPMKTGSLMVSNQYYLEHNRRIERQRYKKHLGALIAGHKKDVVLTNRLNQLPQRVAIYGWHRPSGSPIQPLSLVHDSHYADYSHGIRLVSNVMVFDGDEVDVVDVLKHKMNHKIISNEGPIFNPSVNRQRLTSSIGSLGLPPES